MSNDDFLVFSEEPEAAEEILTEFWHVLVIDDESEIHSVTRLALRNTIILGKSIKIHSAYSAAEAKKMLLENDIYAMAFVDVVMETDRAGLDLISWIRTEHNNTHIRLVLRTGQPGQAPEKDVIANYDINDYKAKTELTATKLYTLSYSCLRAYRDITSLYENKKGLESIISSSNKIFTHQSISDFTHTVLQQLCTLFNIDADDLFSKVNFIAASQAQNSSKIIAATGRFSEYLNHSLDDVIHQLGDKNTVEQCSQVGQHFGDNFFVGVYESRLAGRNLFFIEGTKELEGLERQLIEVFGTNIGVAFDNQAMFAEVELTQREMVYRMSEAVESRSKDTSNHVKRVALTCQCLGKALGLPDKDVATLYKASPLHDIGKIAIADHILNKPGKLTDDEWAIMQNHAQIGRDILASSELEVLSAGAVIAGEHHENWDGSGYPNRIKGENIHIYGRIASIADVFDALINKRCYKSAWSIGDTLDFFKEMSAVKFDPALVALLFEHLDDLIEIQEKYNDHP